MLKMIRIMLVLVGCVALSYPGGTGLTAEASAQAGLTAEAPKTEGGGEGISGPLIYSDDWSFLSGVTTPLPIITEINNNYVTLPNTQNQKGFRCTAEHDKARLDMDGDDEFDTDVKGKESSAVYKIEYPNGVKMNYKMRIFIKKGGEKIVASFCSCPICAEINKKGISTPRQMWAYQRACYMTVKTSLESFVLIDDNNNGYYNDYGQDAIIIGSGKQAIPLSAVIMVKGKFYNLKIESVPQPPAGKIAPNYSGMSLKLTPYEDDTGKIDLVKNLKPPKDSLKSIVIRRGEDTFFHVSGVGETVVPVGEYYLVSAIFSRRIRARSSDKPLVTVEKDKTAAPKWGEPFKLNISPYCEKGGEFTIVTAAAVREPPTYIRKYMDCPFIKMSFPSVVGSLGEEYYATEEFRDERGFAFPDGGVGSFNVEIRPKDGPPGQKPLNKMVGNQFCERWMQVNLSGLRTPAAPFWEDYSCPIEKYRGKVIVKVWTPSSVFGELSFEQEIEVAE